MKRFICALMTVCLLLCLCGCGSSEQAEEPHIHRLTMREVAPTCTEGGFTWYICTACGFNMKADFVPPLENGGHDYVNLVCTRCDDFLRDEAVDTAELAYRQETDRDGNPVYVVTGIQAGYFSDDFSYIKIPAEVGGIPVTHIEEKAFWNFRYLKYVILPETIVRINNKAFQYCFSLISINIPDSVLVLGSRVFWDCHDLKDITIGKNVTEINDGLFMDCFSLESIVLPDGVRFIGPDAFNMNFSLRSITIPKSVTWIYEGAFWKVYNLTDIYYGGTVEDWNAIHKTTGYYYNNEEANWDSFTGDYTVHCTDGDITKSESSKSQ